MMHDREELASRKTGIEAHHRGAFGAAVPAPSRRVAVAPHDAEAIWKVGNARSACGMHPRAVAILAAQGFLLGGAGLIGRLLRWGKSSAP